jgi:hypothetical protein
MFYLVLKVVLIVEGKARERILERLNKHKLERLERHKYV